MAASTALNPANVPTDKSSSPDLDALSLGNLLFVNVEIKSLIGAAHWKSLLQRVHVSNSTYDVLAGDTALLRLQLSTKVTEHCARMEHLNHLYYDVDDQCRARCRGAIQCQLPEFFAPAYESSTNHTDYNFCVRFSYRNQEQPDNAFRHRVVSQGLVKPIAAGIDKQDFSMGLVLSGALFEDAHWPEMTDLLAFRGKNRYQMRLKPPLVFDQYSKHIETLLRFLSITVVAMHRTTHKCHLVYASFRHTGATTACRKLILQSRCQRLCVGGVFNFFDRGDQADQYPYLMLILKQSNDIMN